MYTYQNTEGRELSVRGVHIRSGKGQLTDEQWGGIKDHPFIVHRLPASGTGTLVVTQIAAAATAAEKAAAAKEEVEKAAAEKAVAAKEVVEKAVAATTAAVPEIIEPPKSKKATK